MKIRLGFVSNSSSSSFCICGVCISKLEQTKIFEDFIEDFIKKNSFEDLIEKIKSANDYHFKKLDKDGLNEEEMKKKILFIFERRLKYFLKVFGVESKVEELLDGYDEDENYYGCDLTKIGMNQTLKQYMEEVKKELEKIGIKNKKVEIHNSYIEN